MAVNEVVVNGVTELSLVNDTVSEDTLLENVTAHDASGKQITGKVVVTPVDSELNVESENAIQNKAVVAGINNAVNGVKEYANGIISNPNLLDNPDFSINQRGQTEYSGSPGYCVDRWYRNEEVTVTVLAQGLSCGYSGTTNPTVYQKIENSQFLRGKTVTISVIADGTSYCASGVLPNDLSTNITHSLFARLDGSTDVPANSIPHIRIQVFKSGLLFVINNIARVERVKLELGKVSTIDIEPPPNPATELAKCQRHLLKLSPYIRYGASRVSSADVDFFIPTPTTMRTLPTIDLNNIALYYLDGVTVKKAEGFVFAVPFIGSNGFIIRAVKASHGLTWAYIEFTDTTSSAFASAEL